MVATASVIDWRTRRIPNLITFPLALGALVANGVVGGGVGVGAAAIGVVVGLLIFFVDFMRHLATGTAP